MMLWLHQWFPLSPLSPRADVDWELPRQKVRLGQQLGIGEFGPILDTEVQLSVNVVSRAMVKVSLSLSELIVQQILLHAHSH